MQESDPSLTFSISDFDESLSAVATALQSYLESSRLAQSKVVDLKSVPDWSDSLELKSFLSRAGETGDVSLIDEFLQLYLHSTIRLNDPRFIGHQVARPHFASAIADLVNGLTNNGMAVYEMGPGPVTIEKFVVDWLLQFFPEPSWQTASGFLTHGGSIANLTALLAARSIQDPKSWEIGVNPNHVFLVPDTSHYCVKRAISILGYGSNSIRYLKTNRVGQIDVDQLEATFAQAKSAGQCPIAISANACSTPTGLYDNLESIGRFARRHHLWFHVDGAHGASALVSHTHRELLRGIEYADSVVWDQHKLLQTSALCTAVLFRNRNSLNSIFYQQASYLNESQDEDCPNLFRHTIECTKVPMGLKLYLCLLACGETGIARFVETLFARTKQIKQWIESRPGFKCPCEPQSNILCFQYQPDRYDQFEIRERIVGTGEFYFTQTELAGEQFFRFTVTNPETDAEIINQLLDKIEDVAVRLNQP